MNCVTLGNTGLTTSILGYGCAGLMRPTDERERLGLLATAYDCGIRHFDVARYYGHGGAESVLGKFLRDARCRDLVTITTKFGMEPSPLGRSSRGKSLIGLARRAASLHPGLRKILAGLAGRSVRTNRFDLDSARRSLETSLRELSTDRIDLFLLHEATLADTRAESLLDFLEEAKRAGKIRAFGLGTILSHAIEIVTHAPAFAPVVQVANGFGHWELERLPPDPARGTLTHGALKILQRPDTKVAGDWGRFGRLGEVAVAGLLLGLSLHENPRGVTLFSSIQPQRIRENVAGASARSTMSASDWSEFKQLAAEKFAALENGH